MIDKLLEFGETLAAMGTFIVVLTLAYKHGAFTAWVKTEFRHLVGTVDRIEKSNDSAHDGLHKRIDTLKEDCDE